MAGWEAAEEREWELHDHVDEPGATTKWMTKHADVTSRPIRISEGWKDGEVVRGYNRLQPPTPYVSHQHGTCHLVGVILAPLAGL